MNIIGEVDGKTCVLIDDIVDTAGTLCAAAAALKSSGASKVVAYCTHPVLSGPAIDNLTGIAARRAGGHRHDPAVGRGARLHARSASSASRELLAETIRRIAFGESVSTLVRGLRRQEDRAVGVAQPDPDSACGTTVDLVAGGVKPTRVRSSQQKAEQQWQPHMKSRLTAARTRAKVRAAACVAAATVPAIVYGGQRRSREHPARATTTCSGSPARTSGSIRRSST